MAPHLSSYEAHNAAIGLAVVVGVLSLSLGFADPDDRRAGYALAFLVVLGFIALHALTMAAA